MSEGLEEGQSADRRWVTVCLTARARQALTETALLTGQADADTVSDALVVYEWIMELKRDKRSLYIDGPGGLNRVEIS